MRRLHIDEPLAYSFQVAGQASYRMLLSLEDILGAAVPVRVGGTTANHAINARPLL